MFQKTRKAVMAIGFGFMLTLAASSVAAQDVTTNAMPGVDFSKFHTYKWVTVEGAKYPNQIVDQQIKNSIDAQLAAKGLTKTDGDNADLHIAYQVGMQQQTQWNAYGMGGRWAAGWPPLKARPSISVRSYSTCMTHRLSNLSGLAARPKR